MGLVLKIQKCREDVILPEVTNQNAGIDLRVLTEDGQSVTIQPHEAFKFRTGIKMDIPEGYYIEVLPRSSTGVKKNLRLLNTAGILDEGWKGETLLFVENTGEFPVTVENNERLFQMILHKVYPVIIQEVDKVGTSERGEGGFGSTNYDKSGKRVL